MNTLKRKILFSIILSMLACSFTGCASWERSMKTWESDYSGGLNRTLNVYDYQGNLIASYSGKIDLQESESKVLFDLDGVCYVYYNFPVEVIEITVGGTENE